MSTISSTQVFSPQHCGYDRLTDINDTKQCLVEYIYWSSYAYRNRQCAGQLYLTLLSFRDDAESVFVDVRDVVKNMPWENVADCVEIVRCYVPDSTKTMREISAIIGLCAYAATYWGGEDYPTSNSLNALFVMLEMLTYTDYAAIFQRMN
ncbi:hypothetical protein SKPV-WA-191 [Skunkpox virus]|uniref:Uncharacterized protein n=1 Tax=Skunkpox virus TaxID=160796 RepID=A0A1C9KC12_9POXV|nr:hypothetical protein BIZ96_gp191 [Skunkpox virus]AOP31670.1 hypothetical protein SKPV-WA-191 [Skunkpox virus]